MSPRPQAWGHGETSVVAAESEVEICDSSGSPGAPTQCVHRRDTGSLPAQGAGTPRAPGNGPIGSRFAPARVRDAQWWSSFRENEVSILRARVVNWERVLSSFSCLRLSVAGGFPGPRPLLTDSPPSPGAASGPPASLHPLQTGFSALPLLIQSTLHTADNGDPRKSPVRSCVTPKLKILQRLPSGSK